MFPTETITNPGFIGILDPPKVIFLVVIGMLGRGPTQDIKEH